MSEYTTRQILEMIEDYRGKLSLLEKDLSGIDLSRETIRAELERIRQESPDMKPLWWSYGTNKTVERPEADLGEAELADPNDLVQVEVEPGGINLIEAVLFRVDLRNANLSGANLQGADLFHANLSNANLSGANLQGADLFHANLSNANLSETNLDRAELFRANLTHANLSGASLCEAHLFGADLKGAILDDANLSGADIHGANFQRVNLKGVDLRGVDLQWAIFEDVNFRGAIWSNRQMRFLLRANQNEIWSRLSWKLSAAYPRLLSKGHASRFVVHVYPDEVHDQLQKTLRNLLGEGEYKQVLEDIDVYDWLGEGIEIELYSSDIEFKSPIVKKLDVRLNEFLFTGKPKDNCKPGKEHTALLTVRHKKTGHELKSMFLEVHIVDYAFDHISRPLLSKVTAGFSGFGAVLMFALTMLEQIDTTFGLTSGVAAGAVAAAIYARYMYLFHQTIKSQSP